MELSAHEGGGNAPLGLDELSDRVEQAGEFGEGAG
jgi:hypothetical protein